MPVKPPDQPSGKQVSSAKPEVKPEGKPEGKGRKPWVKKSPVQVVIDQADKLREEIVAAEEDLKAKRKQLQKFEEAVKLFQET